MKRKGCSWLLAFLLFVTACGPEKTAAPELKQGRTKHKTVVLVVDSLTNTSIQLALKDCRFPAIQYLVKKGYYDAHVISSFPSMTVSNMSTVITGAFPEQHRIPGLVWFDVNKKEIVNYGNNVKQTILLGPNQVAKNAFYALNQTHLSNKVHTVYEDLQDAGYSTAAINMLVYRGRSTQTLSLPAYLRWLTPSRRYLVLGPDTLIFGELSGHSLTRGKHGVFSHLGLNDDLTSQSLIQVLKNPHSPDFTMAYFPDNDMSIHKHGPTELTGVLAFEKNLEQILSIDGNWDKTLNSLTLVVMGDSGVSKVVDEDHHPTIFIQKLLRKNQVYDWGTRVKTTDDVALAINSRMAYVYLLRPHVTRELLAEQLKADKRIDIIAWSIGDGVAVTTPEHAGEPLTFYKHGPYVDQYGQSFRLSGDPKLLDLVISKTHHLNYGRYPDVLQQLWSATRCQPGRYLIVTAKKGYQFGDHRAPKHANGAQQASLLGEDVWAPMIVNGTSVSPKSELRFIDLKPYFIALVKRETIR